MNNKFLGTGIFLASILLFSSAQAISVTAINAALEEQVDEAREALQKTGRRSQRYNNSSETLAVQRNVVRPSYSEVSEKIDPLHVRTQIENAKRLDYAIKQRQARDFKAKYIRDAASKNRLTQIQEHNDSLAEAGVDTSPSVNRTGELQDVPNYRFRRHSTESSTVRKNSKQVFRKRLVDYYVDGGDAGTESLRSDVIKSSEHTINRSFAPSNKTSNADAADVAAIRTLQRNRFVSGDKVPTGYQKTTFKRGVSYNKNYSNPYQFQILPE